MLVPAVCCERQPPLLLKAVHVWQQWWPAAQASRRSVHVSAHMKHTEAALLIWSPCDPMTKSRLSNAGSRSADQVCSGHPERLHIQTIRQQTKAPGLTISAGSHSAKSAITPTTDGGGLMCRQAQ